MLQRENKHDFRMADWRDEREGTMGNTRDSGLNNWLGVDVEFGT